MTERQKLPPEVAALSAEAKRTVDSMAGMTGTARRLLDERLQQIGVQLARCEARLAAAERELANLDAIEVEATWVARCLADFDKVWDVLSPGNRGRLLRAVIQRVEVDEPTNKVSVFIADLSAGLSTPEPTQEAAS
jgi:hypothetical protein